MSHVQIAPICFNILSMFQKSCFSSIPRYSRNFDLYLIRLWILQPRPWYSSENPCWCYSSRSDSTFGSGCGAIRSISISWWVMSYFTNTLVVHTREYRSQKANWRSTPSLLVWLWKLRNSFFQSWSQTVHCRWGWTKTIRFYATRDSCYCLRGKKSKLWNSVHSALLLFLYNIQRSSNQPWLCAESWILSLVHRETIFIFFTYKISWYAAFLCNILPSDL